MEEGQKTLGYDGVHYFVGWSILFEQVPARRQYIVVIERQDAVRMFQRRGQSQEDVVVLQDHLASGVWPDGGVQYDGVGVIVPHSLNQVGPQTRPSTTSEAV